MDLLKYSFPQRLELTAADESVLLDHLPVFERNGFQFEVEQEAAAGRRVRLAALPTSRNWVFGKEDIEELIFMLSEGAGEQELEVIRPSRVRAMFASRACRSSVMIGTALSRRDMERLVRIFLTLSLTLPPRCATWARWAIPGTARTAGRP